MAITYRGAAQIKRERGDASPRTFLPFRSRASHAAVLRRRLGGQNLAALSTAAGENLAAVGSSHSLTETVNLGTMTAAGLIGTLHDYTSCQNGFHMLDSQKTAATHNN